MPESLRAALEAALDNEYRAEARAEAAIAAFGPVGPFVQIAESERSQVDALLQLFERYGFEPPPNRWRGHVPRPADVGEACREAARTADENTGLYDRLLTTVTEADVLAVFTRLRDAVQTLHRPALEHCADRTRHLDPT